MAPTVFRQGAFTLANSKGLSAQQLAEVEQLIVARRLEIEDAWHKHFPG